MSEPLRIVIAEDNYRVREGLRRLLEDSGQSLEGDHPILARLRADRVTALRCFSSLCDALGVLHGEGMMHRSLAPHTVTALDSQKDPAVYLDGFQLY